MRLVTLFVPGLASRHVDGGALASLREDAPRQRASLVPSFPPLRACVRASVAAGAPSSHHGIRFEEDGPLPPQQDLLRVASERAGLGLSSATVTSAGELDAKIDGDGALRLEFPGVVEALEQGRPGSRAEQEALADLDALLDGILQHEPSRFLVHGSTALLPVSARLDGEVVLGAAGLRVQAEDCVAWIEGESDQPEPRWRDRILTHEGIARILGGRALELHHAPSDRGWAVVCERGWSFGPALVRATTVDAADRNAPVVLGWGPKDVVWPPAVHDHRLGPTLAGALGKAVEMPFDRPLPF